MVQTIKFVFFLALTLLIAQLYAQTPELIIPSGHSAWITDAAVSRDGKYFVTGSYDNTIKIWDYTSRREVKTLYGHTSIVNAIAISPDNNLIASASSDGDIRLWQINNGQLLKKYSYSKWIRSLAFSPNNKYLAGSSVGHSAFVYDLPSDSLLWSTELNGQGGKVEFFPDGKRVAVMDKMPAGTTTQISIFDVSSGDFNKEQSFGYIHGDIIDYSVSATGRYIFSLVSTDSSNVRVHDMLTQKDTIRFQGHKKSLGSIVSGEDDGIFYSFIRTSFPQAVKKSEIKKWDWRNKRCLDSVVMLGTNSISEKLLFSAHYKQLIIPASSKAYHIYETNRLTKSGIIRGFTSLINDFHEFEGGRFLLDGDEGTLKDINLSTGIVNTFIPRVTLGNSPVSESVLLAGGNSIITRSSLKKNLLKVDLSTRKVVSLPPLDSNASDIVYNREFNKLAVVTRTGLSASVSVLDTNGKTLAKSEFGDKRRSFLSAFLFSSDSKLAIRIFQLDSLIVWDFKNGEVSYQPDPTKGRFVYEMAMLDSNRLLESDGEGKLFLRNLRTAQIDDEWQGDAMGITDITLEPLSRRMLTGGGSGEVRLWNTDSMTVIRSFNANKSQVTNTGFTKLPGVIYSYGMDNAMHFWDVNTGSELVTMTLLDTIQYVITKPGGLFDASPGAMKLMYYVVNDSLDKEDPWKIIELDQLKHRYYQPGLLPIQLGYNNEKLRQVPELETIELAPKVKSSIVGERLLVHIENQGGGIGPIAIYLDGAELTADARPSAVSNALPELSINFDLNPCYSRIIPGRAGVLKVIAWNRNKWISSRPDTISFQLPAISKGVELVNTKKKVDTIPPKLYAVVFGTSDYTGKQIDLSYSSKDAIDFANALELAAENLFGPDNTEIFLFNSEETKDTDQPDKRNFISTMASLERKMKPWDILVVYLSGHGINYGGSDGDFYYLTRQASGSDAVYLSDPQIRNNVAISSMEMTDMLNKISAKKKILILDACASGKAAETMLAAVRDVPASQVRALDRMRDRTGFYILSGSASDAVSYESSVYGQGLLTYSLLKAIRGAALRVDGNEEFLDVQKLLTYAVDEVPQLASGIGGTQKPLYRSPDDQRSFDIGKVDGKTKQAIIISEPKPVFVAAGFQDPDQLFDDIGLSEQINASFREVTAKGKAADFIFTEAKDYPGAYRVTGTYEKKGDNLSLRYVLTRDKVRLGDIRLFENDFSKPNLFVENFLRTLKQDPDIN